MANKKDDDEYTMRIKNLRQLLNKITMDNFSQISEEILRHAESQDIVDDLIKNIVQNAWKQIRYTKCYA